MGSLDLALWAREYYEEQAAAASARLLDAGPVDPRAHRDVQQMQLATSNEFAGTLVLLDAPWDIVEIDWMKRGPFSGRALAPQGFAKVCPGRHEIKCGRAPRLPVVVYRREVVVRRLVGKTWEPVTTEVQAHVEAAIARDDFPL